MADDHAAGESSVPVLDLAFDPGTLDALRAGVKAYACQVGLTEDRAEDVVLAVHELAANAVSHGAGAGRLRTWKRSGVLYCQVDDGEPLASEGPERPLSTRLGHGLWLVRQVADRMRIRSAACGTQATIAFNLPALTTKHPWPRLRRSLSQTRSQGQGRFRGIAMGGTWAVSAAWSWAT